MLKVLLATYFGGLVISAIAAYRSDPSGTVGPGTDLSRSNRVRLVRSVGLLGVLLVSLGLFAAAPASARTGGEANPLLGTWEHSRPNGATMVWEFTPTTMAFILIDPSGEKEEPGSRTAVSYRKLGRGQGGEGYAVAPADTNGEPAIEIKALITDTETLRLDFPGYGPLELVRVRP